ncbi:MAG: DNA polymerase III subunit gamma/tau [Acidimicrobiaceae bacterium]|nr:DNA polymerase III subunit gamma/tau [Acidimicrobiaceae bacterium]
MAYQSLYRRYRPQKFSEIKGQDHVVRALHTAVRENTVGHAYLLHGPRGSGKTSTARVLAKALNCTDLGDDGEPCCVCESCVSIQQGRSFDLQELDAASNNKVDDMRSLLERVNLASPGRAKVYLLDEVHMLTSGAENALLKTLEEPPAHVTWVLATTEPHKVVQTIRSRCQVFELGLISSDIMSEHLRYVVADAGLDADSEAIDHAVAAGGGSVRDTLTALERVVAGGGTADLDASTDAILAAVAEGDRAAALSAVGDAIGRGRDPRTIGEMALAGLRDAFLTAMADPPARLSEHERARAADLAGRMAPAAMTRALETLGRALIDMRQAPDPRVDIEVALVRLCQPDEDRSLEALAQRVRQLEARLDGSPGAAPAGPGPVLARPEPPPAPPPPQQVGAPASSLSAPARRALSEQRAAPQPAARPSAASASAGGRAAAARRALEEQRASAPAVPAAPAPVGAGGPASTPPPPVPVPDLAAMRPRSPTEVVELARRHLALEPLFVVARAKELEPDPERRREPAQLQALWQDLLEHAPRTGAEPAPSPASPSAGSPPSVPAVAAPPAGSPSLALSPASPSAGSSSLALSPASPSAGSSSSVPAVAAPPAGSSSSAPSPASPSAGSSSSVPVVAAPPAGAAEPALSPGSPSAGSSSSVPVVAAPPAGSSSSALSPGSPSAGSSSLAPVVAVPPAEPDSPVAPSQDRPEPERPPNEPDAGLEPPDFDDDIDSFDLAELDALDEAPSHAHDIEQKIKSAFPGTLFELLPDPDDEPGSET